MSCSSLLVCTMAAAAAAATSQHQWRHIDPSRPPPTSLNDAAALYTHARGKVEMEMVKNGHPIPNTARPAATSSLGSCASGGDGSGGGPLITPTEFGGDPSGKTDSTAALMKAMAALTNVSAHANHAMASGIADLGGATLDLEGGEYLISASLIIPPHVGTLSFIINSSIMSKNENSHPTLTRRRPPARPPARRNHCDIRS